MKSTDRYYKNERLRASEYAERLHPDNPEARQTAFEARFEALKARAIQNEQDRANGIVKRRKSVPAVCYETGRFRRGCAGFGYIQNRIG